MMPVRERSRRARPACGGYWASWFPPVPPLARRHRRTCQVCSVPLPPVHCRRLRTHSAPPARRFRAETALGYQISPTAVAARLLGCRRQGEGDDGRKQARGGGEPEGDAVAAREIEEVAADPRRGESGYAPRGEHAAIDGGGARDAEIDG